MRVLIIDTVHPVLVDGLESLGYEVDYKPNMTRGELVEAVEAYDGLVVRTKTDIDREVLLKAGRLSFIGRAGSGVDNIDTDFCDRKGIVYFNAGEANADAVGEHTIGMLLALHAKIVRADREVRNQVWDREGNRGEELKGKTIAIIGYGNTGKAVARKLSGFEMRVLAYDKYLVSYSDQFAIESTMERIYKEAEIITFHVPLTNETKAMVNDDYLTRFEKPFYLLNMSRGKVVRMEDLVKMLKCGKVKGAALDVLENENISSLTESDQQWFGYLKNAENVVLTPHIAGWTVESFRKISEVLLQKITQQKN